MENLKIFRVALSQQSTRISPCNGYYRDKECGPASKSCSQGELRFHGGLVAVLTILVRHFDYGALEEEERLDDMTATNKRSRR
jgi:hypothetical protein